jgi:dTDP-4-dehydrorhamnose reductase
MRILVTGGSGQVGSAAAELLKPLGEVIVPGRAALDLARPNDVCQVLGSFRPDVILNAAAYTAVDLAEDEPALAQAVNCDSVGEIGRYASLNGAWVLHFSTDYVFDGTKPSPYAESDIPHPLSVYGRTKLAGEQALRRSGCGHLIVRTSWVYAESGRNFLLTMLRLGAERERLRVINDQYGAPTYARDLAEASAHVMEAASGRPQLRRRIDEGDTVHLSSSGWTTWFGFAEAIFDRAASAGLRRPAVEPISSADYPMKAPRPTNSRFDLSKAESVWGLKPPAWDHALDSCLQRLWHSAAVRS